MIILLNGSEEIGQLIGVENSERRRQLLNQFQEIFGRELVPDFHIEPAVPIRMLQQQMEGLPFPSTLQEQNLTGPYYQAQFHSQLFDLKPDVILLSIEPDLCRPLWHHKAEGFYFSPEPGWEQHWSDAQRAWLQKECEPSALTDPKQFEMDLLALIQELKARRMETAVLVMNCSTIDPLDDLHTYRGLEDSLPLRIHRFNLTLLRLSIEAGISIVDVDRLVAEVGEAHVTKILRYSDEIYQTIGGEIIRIIDDLGLVENDQAIYRLDMPYVDLMVKEGVVTAWHKQVGEAVKAGDDLVDIEAQFKKLKRTQSSLHLSRGKSSKAGGKRERVLVRVVSANSGVLHEIYAQPGSPVQEGTLIAAVSANGLDAEQNQALDVSTAAKFRVSVQKINIGKKQ